jgi:hypothetical protein
MTARFQKITAGSRYITKKSHKKLQDTLKIYKKPSKNHFDIKKFTVNYHDLEKI